MKVGQCGFVGSNDVETPHLVKLPNDYKIKSIECGRQFNLVITRNNRLITFGRNQFAIIKNKEFDNDECNGCFVGKPLD